jgi:hypothetical protein
VSRQKAGVRVLRDGSNPETPEQLTLVRNSITHPLRDKNTFSNSANLGYDVAALLNAQRVNLVENPRKLRFICA